MAVGQPLARVAVAADGDERHHFAEARLGEARVERRRPLVVRQRFRRASTEAQDVGEPQPRFDVRGIVPYCGGQVRDRLVRLGRYDPISTPRL